MKLIIPAIILLSLLTIDISDACTIIMVSDSQNKIAGNNEDSFFPLTLVWFTPAAEGSYARVSLGYRMIFNSIQGGMNEKGLFIDGNSLGAQGWKSDPSKETFRGVLLDHILATCADIEDVKEFFSRFNVSALNNARIPVMDKNGESMIIEWYNNQVVFLQNELPYQVSTNFVESGYLNSEKPCWRYNRAMEMLENRSSYNIQFVSEILDATHVESHSSTTVYSFICDLVNGDIYIYNFHDFSRHVKFNLEKEIKNGTGEKFFYQLFGNETPGYPEFISNGPKYMVERGFRANRNNGILFYNILKLNYPSIFNMNIDESVLSYVGMTLLGEGKVEDAVYIFEKNRSEFPESPGVFYDLGYGYENNGNHGSAIEAYKQALYLDPGFEDAINALARLEKNR